MRVCRASSLRMIATQTELLNGHKGTRVSPIQAGNMGPRAKGCGNPLWCVFFCDFCIRSSHALTEPRLCVDGASGVHGVHIHRVYGARGLYGVHGVHGVHGVQGMNDFLF